MSRGDADEGDQSAALARERRKLQLTLDIGRALSSTTGRETLYERIVANVTEIMEADRSTLYLVEEDARMLVSRVAEGPGTIEVRVAFGEGIAGFVASVGKTVNIADAYEDPRFQSSVDAATGYRTRSVLCTPLKGSVGEVIGVLQVLNKRQGAFDDSDVELATALAGQVAVAVENARLYDETLSNNLQLMAASERLRKQTSDIEVLLQLEREVSSALSPRDIYDRLLRTAMHLVEARAGSIALKEEGGKMLRFETTAGPAADAIAGRRIAIGDGLIGWVVRHRRAAIANEPGADNRHDRELAAEIGTPPVSLLCVPLVSEGEVVGAIELLDRAGGFHDSHLQLIELIAGQVARAVVTARRRSARDAEDRLATIGEMMATVLHDLRTPMTVISGYTDLMTLSDEADERERYAGQVQAQFEIMNGMIKEILAFARGDTQLLLSSVGLNVFLSEVDTQLRPALERRDIALAIDTGFGGEVRIDRVKMLRLVANLANNAAVAMSHGGRFEIRSSRDNDDFVLEFSDDGPGIPPELEGRLFEAFARGSEGGTGLGLAIVKRIVDQHGGTVSVESRRGQGTTFRVKVPIAGPPAAPPS